MLRMKKRFWPQSTTLILCADALATQGTTVVPFDHPFNLIPCFVDVVWFDGFHMRNDASVGTVTCFIVGPEAALAVSMPHEALVKRLLAQLDEMFGVEARPRPGTYFIVVCFLCFDA